MKKGTLIYWQDGEWMVGRLRERPDVFSQGRDLHELEVNIKEALRLMQQTDLEGFPADTRSKEILLEA